MQRQQVEAYLNRIRKARLDLVSFPACCTFKILQAFRGDESFNNDYAKQLTDSVNAAIEYCMENHESGIAVTLNERQMKSGEVLEKLGFIASEPMYNRRYAHCVTLYTLMLEEDPRAKGVKGG